jgi:hypothetical protein
MIDEKLLHKIVKKQLKIANIKINDFELSDPSWRQYNYDIESQKKWKKWLFSFLRNHHYSKERAIVHVEYIALEYGLKIS